MEEGSENLLAGCVILYNPTHAVISSIESYLKFLNVLYIIDNSECFDNKLVEKIKAIDPKIIYIQQGINLGIASALNTGCSLAVTSGYQWLLTMDQDSYFLGNEFFQTWYNNIDQNAKIGVIAASYTNEYDRWQREYSNQYNEIHFAVTSGNIINLRAWENIRGFEEKLFIDEVDHDYCLKLRKDGYKILISKKVLMGHMIGEFYNEDDNNLISKRNFTLHNPLRYYYMSRNVLYLCKKYFFIDFGFVSRRFYYLIKSLAKILLRYPNKKDYLSFFFKGIKDFGFAKYNRYDH